MCWTAYEGNRRVQRFRGVTGAVLWLIRRAGHFRDVKMHGSIIRAGDAWIVRDEPYSYEV